MLTNVDPRPRVGSRTPHLPIGGFRRGDGQRGGLSPPGIFLLKPGFQPRGGSGMHGKSPGGRPPGLRFATFGR